MVDQENFNINEKDVNKKIEKALNPSLNLDSGIDQLKSARVNQKTVINKTNKTNRKKIVLITLFLTILFCRSHKATNFTLSNFIFKTERVFNLDLALLKSVLAIDYKLDATSFTQLIKQGDSKMVSAYINWGVDLEQRDFTGKTPLIHTIESNNIELTKLLISEGANIYSEDENDKYPKDYAINKPEILKVLIANGLKVQNVSDVSVEQEALERKTKEDNHLQSTQENTQQENELITDLDKNQENISEETLSSEEELSQEDAVNNNLKASYSKTKAENKSLYEDKEREKQTGVKVARRPKGVFLKTNNTRLLSVTTVIRNFGNYPAKGVSAELIIPGYEDSLPLSGPSELAPYESAEFSAEPNLTIFIEGRLKAKVACTNCYQD